MGTLKGRQVNENEVAWLWDHYTYRFFAEGAIYRDRASHDPMNSGKLEDPGHIGIYASDAIWSEKGDFHGPENAILVGRVGICAAL